ncbi:MAG: nicotinate (nicotinamide) nucleotide adenylyltransferase [Tissierellales bacterium]|nr:nicotinate (nicotinamide) nucleotide adenylyltransferase [Tissierellales bacterium]
MPIGIMGGTFNPIHIGHLIISEFVRCEFELDYILFVPNGNPPHKKKSNLIDANLRLSLIEKAIRDNNYFKSSDIELSLNKINYTVDTLKALKSMYSKEKFYFLIGMDTLFELDSWKDFNTVAKLTDFIVYQRQGYEKKKIDLKIKELEELYGTSVFISNGPYIDISSTFIRERANKGLTLRYLVPDSILEDVLKIYGGT